MAPPAAPANPDIATTATPYLEKDPPMENPTREQIIHRAYGLWEQAGKPDGRDDEFYHQAERELKEEARDQKTTEKAEPRLE
jgi:hypothetical protein